MHMLLSFLLLMIIAAVNAYFAKQRGRDPVGWFLIGLLLGVFGLLILFLLPKKPKELDLEQDEDRILAGFSLTEENLMIKEWYYLDANHKQAGPVSFDQLRKIWEDGSLSSSSYVWCAGMAQWEQIENLPLLKDAISPLALGK